MDAFCVNQVLSGSWGWHPGTVGCKKRRGRYVSVKKWRINSLSTGSFKREMIWSFIGLSKHIKGLREVHFWAKIGTCTCETKVQNVLGVFTTVLGNGEYGMDENWIERRRACRRLVQRISGTMETGLDELVRIPFVIVAEKEREERWQWAERVLF